MENKKCTQCQIEKEISDFSFRNSTQRYQSECKACENERNRKYKIKNKEKIDTKNKEYRKQNKELIKKRDKNYRLKNKDKIKELNKIYRIKNKTNRNLKSKLRKQKDPLFKLRDNIGKLILKTFKQKSCKKSNKTTDILGCSIPEFKIYIEKQFESWMNWGNHGRYNPNKQTWQLDHIIPISLATTKESIMRLNHYTNFQPMEAMKNLLKSNKLQ